MLHDGAIQFVPARKTSFINFGGAKNWTFLKKFLSLQIVFGKQRVSHAVAESFKIVMSVEMRRENNKRSVVRN